ncbi:hypothetical protein BDZ45DRAFT_714455 [Acephala macrosclerotiorum]|nr:hypothetical protein BDZ45DRAFT_714455 [Acephala macrosclerotiorum]
MAAPSQQPRADAQGVNVIATSQVIGYSCSDKLDTGYFADLPISANVDGNGSGTLTIDVSGGITCTGMFNAVEMYMTCSASVPSSMELTLVTKRESCFQSASPSMHMAANAMLNGVAAPPVGNLTKRDAEVLHERQAPCGQWSSETQILSVKSMSHTIGWPSSATADEWLTGGFDVSVSWTTGNTYSCTGNSGDTVCVWYNTAHTAHTIQNGAYNDCTGFSPSGGDLVMYSPNSNNVGGGYYCVIGTCRSQGSEYWNYDSPAGSPQ